MMEKIDFQMFIQNEKTIVILDNCTILDLYRYSPEVSKSLLNVFNSVKSKLWLPQQVYDEFSENKESVFSEQFNQFKNIATQVNQKTKTMDDGLSKSFFVAKNFYYPQVNHLENLVKQKIAELKSIAETYEKNISESIAKEKEYQLSNEPNKFVEDLLNNRQVGPGFSKFEKISIYSEGNIRYKLEYPPGYKDSEKDTGNKCDTRKFGDLILWKELLKKAKDKQAPILFVTSDVKEDWWSLDSNGNIQTMHQLLSEEFQEYTGMAKEKFLMLTTGDFFELMVQMIEQATGSYKMNELISVYSLNKDIIASKLFNDSYGAHDLIDLLELNYYFANSGELQDCVSDIIQDVDVRDVLNFEIEDTVFYNDDDSIIYELLPTLLVDIEISSPAIEDLTIAYRYDVDLSFKIKITIPKKTIEEIVKENPQPIIRNLDQDEFLLVDEAIFEFYDLSITSCIETLNPFDDHIDESDN